MVLGAVVLSDTRRLAGSFPAIDYFERRQIPFIVALNCFDDAHRYDTEDIRTALDLEPEMPVILSQARSKESTKDVPSATASQEMATSSSSSPLPVATLRCAMQQLLARHGAPERLPITVLTAC